MIAAPGEPITTWHAVGELLGKSYDTVLRRRKARGDQTVLPFRDADEVWAWWRAMNAPTPAPARKPRPSRVARLDGPLDPAALTRSLTR